MSPLVLLGARLVRAGGPLRAVSLAAGCAVAVALLAAAWALPDALYPVMGPDDANPQRGVLVSLLALVVVPVAALLLAVGRLSSTVRDRRLAALHLLGVSRARLALVAAVESGIPALLGAGLGVVGFVAVRAVLEHLLDPVLRGPITGGWRLAAVVLSVAVLSVLLALASLRRLDDPRAAASESARPRLSPWRLAPVPVALVCFGTLLTTSPEEVDDATVVALLLGLAASGVAVVLVTPLVSSWVSGTLSRTGSVPALLAGRAVQTQPAATGRRVVALGLTVFVAFAAAGYLGVYESTPHLAYAIRSIEEGPQRMFVAAGESQEDLRDEVLPAVEQVDGVLDIEVSYAVDPVTCSEGDGSDCPSVYVGTCERLERAIVVTGCRDDQAAWIMHDGVGDVSPAWAPERVGTLLLADRDSGVTYPVPLPGEMAQDDDAVTSQSPLGGERYDVFVPQALADAWGARVSGLEVTARGGPDLRDRLHSVVVAHGAWGDVPELHDYRQVVTVRTTVWSVVGIAVAVSLLTYGLTTIDRARERRRGRARLVAVGVPARVLRRAQALAGALPLVVAVVIGTGLGVVATAAYSHVAGAVFAIEPTVLALMIITVLVGALAVSFVTLPLTRSSVTAEDLRQE
ncbi:hypothetical protein [Cellulosimicrobium cellulans]|uniref:hypothetical protein n=1 Tax=Cellulosimicrobium cellulans TaxID=1710 RepID=UPI00381CB63F